MIKKKGKKKKIRAVTPIGIISYPYLAEADEGREESDGKFKADLFVRKSDFKEGDGKDLRQKVLAVGRKKFGEECSLGDFKGPFQDVDKLSDEKKEALPKALRSGYIRIRAKSKFQPMLIDASKEDLSEKQVKAIKGGDFVRFAVGPYTYNQQAGGVALGLNVVQFVKTGPALGQGKAETLKMFDDLEVEAEDIDDDEDEAEEVDDGDEDTDDSDDDSSDGRRESDESEEEDEEEEERPKKKKKRSKSVDDDDDEF